MMKALLLFVLLSSAFIFGCTQLKTDPKACESAPAEYSQRDQCFREVARNTKDPSICEKVNDQILKNYWCYRDIAYDTNNSATCGLIPDDAAKQSCLNVLSGKEPFERGTRP